MHPLVLHRAPSRLLWFLVGAGVATYWHHASAMHDQRAPFLHCLTHRHRTQDIGQQSDWEHDSERLQHLQKRAGETVADLSESTLDSIVAGAESLKAKLAQLRAERERREGGKKAPPPAV